MQIPCEMVAVGTEGTDDRGMITHRPLQTRATVRCVGCAWAARGLSVGCAGADRGLSMIGEISTYGKLHKHDVRVPVLEEMLGILEKRHEFIRGCDGGPAGGLDLLSNSNGLVRSLVWDRKHGDRLLERIDQFRKEADAFIHSIGNLVGLGCRRTHGERRGEG